MYFGIEFGIGFAIGLIFGINLSRLIWPEFNESIWDRKKRENKIAEDAIASNSEKQKDIDEGHKK